MIDPQPMDKAAPQDDALPSGARLNGPAPDLSVSGILARRLAVYQGRLDQVRARGGRYTEVGFSSLCEDLLARLAAGESLSREVH